MELWVKICGITNPGDARFVERAGANAVGLVFSEKSPRFVSPENARAICLALSERVQKVGVFVVPDWDRIQEILRRVPLDVVQWHGGSLDKEGVRRLSEFGLPWIQAVRWNGTEALSAPSSAFRILVEGRSEKAPGGTGLSWDYGRLSKVSSPLPLILSGGLSPGTVEEVLSQLRDLPLAGVDVSSGVEDRPGIKDEGKVMAFIRSVRNWEKMRGRLA
ncbi:MAG: phosphoribosylanthranilate isomerase [Nitrospirae bacterium]|nr:phosphoribosylanthranilate isomerase [Nitrospirota bacterium]